MSDDFFDYDLPPALIAQQPVARRDQSRLLVLRRGPSTLHHHVFADLPDLLAAGDLLILNDTQVVPARLLGRRQATGGKWEGLFLRTLPDQTWELLCQTRGRLVPGETVAVYPGPLQLCLIERLPAGQWRARPSEAGAAVDLLGRHGHVPLPFYIRRGRDEPGDRERYQTVYARRPGAAAAPTAGLHFTPQIFERLRGRGIEWTTVTLHVGLGTFQPIQEADYRRHAMHAEWGELPPAAADAIGSCRQRGGRVVAVGTTSVRVLETSARESGGNLPAPWSGETSLFIYPPFEFRVADVLLTNFHLPRSSLLLLAGAFAGVDLLRRAYMTAIETGYRFYSYGDAMLIV